ncbi:radial spoke protein 8 [Monoraphidium neglectum]|uniref:Radial spoke protein 8 n=1 Tax=Monoraphidium neglectum TaxID=145388 RepID=A0A0D2MRB7_9CHLO|nr:radial spoke protein 8 [Monoraphidium neglectum]KIZ05125.1 radial spoke protein 8 [Monoraphidium neglectum]|eukprot:XP_013904144.1 radial spoke protein 8 [Monoraphidium neglectum]
MQLVPILSQPQLPADERVVALRVLNSQLANQEAKAEAVAAGAAAAVVALLLGVSGSEGPTNGCGGGSSAQAGGGSGGSDGAGSDLQQQLCCNALEALCHLRQGRAAVVEKAGLHALTAALGSVPDAASAALKAFAMSADGVAHMQQSPARVVSSLVDALGRVNTPLAAARDIAAALAGAAGTETGVVEACGAQVPAAMVALAQRVLRFKLGGDGGGLLAEVLHEACACLRGICHHPDGKVPVMMHAGPSLVNLLKSSSDPESSGSAAAALRLALEEPDARRKLEVLLTPQERAALLGRLPDVPPAYKYVVQIPTRT